MSNIQNQPTGNAGGDKKPRLGDHNSGFYNCSSFAALVKAKDLFNNINKPKLKEYITVGSMYSKKALWLPLEVVMPNFIKANPVFNQPFGNKIHIDRFFPMVMCISKINLDEHLDYIYDDINVYDKCQRFTNSMLNHIREQKDANIDTDYVFNENNIEECTDHETGRKIMEDGDVLVVFVTIFNALQMIANKDMTLRYSDMNTFDDSKVTLGGITAVKRFFSSERNAPPKNKKKDSEPWIYSPEDADKKKGTNYKLGHSKVVLYEHRHMIRMLFKFGKGDNNAPCEERDVDDTTFEMDLLRSICSGIHPSGPGALGLLGSLVTYNCLVNTIIPSERNKDVVADPLVIWTIFDANYLSEFAAPNISYLTVCESGKEPKLKFHMKSRNNLTNLFFTSSKECLSICGMVLYLAEKICRIRCKEHVIQNVCIRCKACEDCNSGEQCALKWVELFTDKISLKNALTDPKKMAVQGPSSKTFNVTLITEYNSKATIMGAMTSKPDANQQLNASIPFITAYHETFKKFKNSFDNQTKILNEKKQQPGLCLNILNNILKDIKTYVYENRHLQTIPNKRSFAHNKKLECILTDNEGGIPKLSMGMLSFSLSQSKVLLFIAKFAIYNNCKLDNFVTNTSVCREFCLTALGKTSIGSFIEKVSDSTFRLKNYQVRPYIHPDTQEEINIGCPPKEDKLCEIFGLGCKAVNRFKMYCGTTKPIDNISCKNSTWSMDIRSDNTTITKEQRDSITSIVNIIIKNKCIKFEHKKHSSMREIVDTLSEPLGQFYYKELSNLRNFKDFLELYIVGLLMVSNDYIAKQNDYFDGISLPRFGEIVNHSELNSDIMNETFLFGGPTILFTRVEIDTFTANITNEKQKFLVCTLREMSKTNIFLPPHVQGTYTHNLRGVFVPIKQIYSGSDPNDAKQDTLDVEISAMYQMNYMNMISHFVNKSSVFAKRVRENNRLEDDDIITEDMMLEMFTNYNATSLIDDKYMLEIAKNIENPDKMTQIETEARNNLMDEEDLGEEVQTIEDDEDSRAQAVALIDDLDNY